MSNDASLDANFVWTNEIIVLNSVESRGNRGYDSLGMGKCVVAWIHLDTFIDSFILAI